MTVPAHVPAEMVYPYDQFLDPGIAVDPHAHYLKIVADNPSGIFYTPANGGHWVVTRYDYYTEVALNPTVFSSEQISVPPQTNRQKMLPIMLDPPEHGKYRRALADRFSPRQVRKTEQDMRDVAIQLVEAVADKGECDFVKAVGERFPVTVFMQMMGMPLSRLEEFRGWAVTAISGDYGDMDKRMEAVGKIVAFMTETIKAREQDPGDDIISDLIAYRIDGRPFTLDELQSFCFLLFTAGLDTVVNATSFGIRHLAQNPELQKELREHPEKASAFLEESLRRYSFVNTGRLIKEDINFHGVEMKAGDMIVTCQAPANLDPNTFEDPLQFDMDRKGPRHIAFNTGPHNCLGAHLARIELAIIYEEWCKRVQDFRVDDSIPIRFNTGSVIGMQNLPLIWPAKD